MLLEFFKYQGTGNDFIIINNSNNIIKNIDTEVVANLCNRKFGIGADGLMLLSLSDKYDFNMRYFNSDGKESTMCGNGGRCIVSFAKKLNLISKKTVFYAVDGEHSAFIDNISEQQDFVSLKMNNVDKVEVNDNYLYLNTGSPHYVKFINNIAKIDVINEGKKIRYNKQLFPDGTNVNFVEVFNDYIFVRTYERGVEDETLSCGTGVTASALASYKKGLINTNFCNVKTLGGELTVKFNYLNNCFSDIWLEGNATFVFKGEINI